MTGLLVALAQAPAAAAPSRPVVQWQARPSARDIASLESDLRGHKVKALIYNTQVTNAMTEQLLAVAEEADVPVVGVTEARPDGMTYPEWMLDQLDALDKALAGQPS